VCGGNSTVGSNPTATASAKGLSLLGPFVLSVRRSGFGRNDEVVTVPTATAPVLTPPT
jgi:hypothetical protein